MSHYANLTTTSNPVRRLRPLSGRLSTTSYRVVQPNILLYYNIDGTVRDG